jgi:hypothetical protein
MLLNELGEQRRVIGFDVGAHCRSFNKDSNERAYRSFPITFFFGLSVQVGTGRQITHKAGIFF